MCFYAKNANARCAHPPDRGTAKKNTAGPNGTGCRSFRAERRLEQKQRSCEKESDSSRSHSIKEWPHITQSHHVTVFVLLL